MAQKAHWGSKASCDKLAFGHCRDCPDKSLVSLCFCKHTEKRYRDVSGLLLALACLFRAEEDRWSFSNVEQSLYPVALPYNFRTLYTLGWFYFSFSYLLPTPTSWKSFKNMEGWFELAYKIQQLCNQTFWSRTLPEFNIFNDYSGILLYICHNIERF